MPSWWLSAAVIRPERMLALQAAQAGTHGFSEKPMATTLDDAVALVERS